MKPTPYFCGHNHSKLSLFDGISRPSEYVRRAAEYGHSAACFTEHGNMFSIVQLTEACQKEGIKPIYGEEFYINLSGPMDSKEKGQKIAHLTILAENEIGFKNLSKLSSRAFLDGFRYNPRIDHEILTKHSEGLICLSGCLKGAVNLHYIKYDDKQAAIAEAERLKSIFGPDRFFLEIQPNSLPDQAKANALMGELSRDMGLECVLTLDSHYTDPAESILHGVRICISQNRDTEEVTLANNKYGGPSGEFYLRSLEELNQLPLLAEFPHCLEVAGRIAERCNFVLELGKIKFPKFPCPEELDSSSYLKYLVSMGFAEREQVILKHIKENGKYNIKDYLNRANYEAEVICSFGFADYFLIIADVMRFCLEKNIGKGDGRGSVVGSLVAYLLHITEIDSLRYDIPFERFINPGRASKGSLPDIDSDFSPDGYEEIIAYVRDKYGPDRVGNILTFSRLGGKSVIKDVGRALGVPQEETARLAAMVPQYQRTKTKFKDILEANPKLSAGLDKVKDYKAICLGLDGYERHTSIHPGGLVITPGPLEDYVPLTLAYTNEEAGKKGIAIQVDKNECEKFGLVKMDYLRVDTVAIIKKAKESVFRHEGVDLTEIPTTDKKTFELLQRGDTDGVFQMGGSKFKRLLIDFKPETIEHLAIINALVRPGAEAGAATCIARRHGKEPPTPIVPELEPVLKDTWGVLVFQDQMLKVCMAVAGMTWGEADDVRKAAGRKDLTLMEQQRAGFVSGAVANGFNERMANSIFDMVFRFGEYGFGLGHSVVYSVEGYKTAFLKANYPAHFISAALNVLGAEEEKRSFWAQIAKNLGIKILPPDINKSSANFEYEDGAIRAGLCTIRGIGEASLATIDLIKEGLDQKKLYGFYFTTQHIEPTLSIEFESEPDRVDLMALHKLIKTHPGDVHVRLKVANHRVHLKPKVNPGTIMSQITELFGDSACLNLTPKTMSCS